MAITPSSIARGGTNLERAGSHNYRVVLTTIRALGSASRSQIAASTGLTRQAVHSIVGRLRAAGLVKITGARSEANRGGRGMPGIAVELAAEGAYSLGLLVDLWGVNTVLADFSGGIVDTLHLPLRQRSVDDVLEAASAARHWLAQQPPARRERLIGAGIAMPGPFRVAGMTDVGPTGMPDLTLPAIQAELASRLDMPVSIHNDASAAALAEHLYGLGRGLESFAYIYFGFGLGAGLIIDGQLHRGRGGNAGEIAHMMVEPGGRPCGCGNRGCLERYVSVHALAESLGLPPVGESTLDDIDRMLAHGEAGLEEWLAIAGRRLRQAINILESTLDLDAVVMGGRISAPLLQAIDRHTRPLAHSIGARTRQTPRLLLGRTGSDVPALGAAALPLFHAFSPKLEALLG
ncbi:Sugar kinase of the NBD/HSP70 family, may contain an N-terminal HTH domain [Arboricoccus pini]|uniref:Sugar kinase of the NBD/HSP70 family, may contain an N-terminal HTH domain n=1 Tax=Arboricoccus pini TaxID=1963835 RepID=A0A212RNQ2_9PROT|nr:ROK family transcriptional regulator [Arboricoccus pini]SNB74062.1 Sugar kinase of the NBD/HSP70 family, may contain an N-terminal HTH domain [Arboricoccus pini]